MIYEDTGKVLTDSLVQENGSHTGVNTARKTEDNLIVAQLFLQLSNCCSTKESALQSCLLPQISTTKFFRSCVPCKEWNTSGWNCTAQYRLFG